MIPRSVSELASAETRVEQSDHTQFHFEPQSMIQCPPSQSAVVSLCPIPISESTTGPGACLLSFTTVTKHGALSSDCNNSSNY